MNKLSQLRPRTDWTAPGVVMNRKSLGKWISVCGLICAAALLFNMASCAHSQELVAIQIQPNSETVGATNIPVNEDAGQQVQLRALGSYIHPDVTKDITSQAVWASNDAQMFTVSSTGMLTATGGACGSTLVSATVTTNSTQSGESASGALITGYMSANVVCDTSTTTGNDALTVTFGQSTGTGAVVSDPAGASCTSPGPCVGSYAPGTTVSLQANPDSGSTFLSWGGCSSAGNVNPCSITMTGNESVTVTFQ
jgi:hypothetical protein